MTTKAMTQAFKQQCVDRYNKGHPIISDMEFDLAFGDTSHHESQVVPPTKQTALPVWMGSLTKVRTNHQLDLWANKHKDTPLELTAKLDGVSGLLGPHATFLYQRGNGKVGQDASKIIPYLNLPKVPYLVRGEIIMPVDVFKHYKSYKNPRNLVAGLLHQKNPDPNDLSKLHFVAYEIINSEDLDFISVLEQDQFNVPIRSTWNPSEPLSFDKLYNTLDLTSYPYETDGIVVRAQLNCDRVTSGNPKHMIALKLDADSDTAVTKVVNVTWNVSKWSILFPVVHLEPVHLRGVTIRNVTGNNAKYIRDMQVGPRAILKIKRSGGVIPKIVEVLKASIGEFCGPNIPYEWVGDVHIKKLASPSAPDVEVLQARLLTALKGLSVKHLGPKGVGKLVLEAQVLSFLDLVRSVKERTFVETCNGIGLSTSIAVKVQVQLQRLLFDGGVEATLLLGCMGTFGPNISYARLQYIAEIIPSFLRSEFIVLDDLLKVKGLCKLANTIYEGYSEAYKVITELNCIGVKLLWPVVPKDEPMKVVYSGFRDLGVPNGLIMCSSVSSKIDLLVVKDLTTRSAKVDRARKLNIPILSREDFITKYLK